MKKISIIVPCYNEEKRLLPEKFEVFSRQNRDIKFIFVNDASTDRTPDILTALCGRLPEQIFCIRLTSNMGKAGAVRAGFLFALNEATEYIGYWDADLSTPLNEVSNLIAPFEDSSIDIVMASRVQLLGRKIERKISRHYFGRFFATLASTILGLKVYDTQCGAKIFRTNETLTAVFSLPFQVNWTFDVEILARYLVLGKTGDRRVSIDKSIIEYPVQEWRDVPGSKVKGKDAFIAILELYKIYSFIYSTGTADRRRALLKNLRKNLNAAQKESH